MASTLLLVKLALPVKPVSVLLEYSLNGKASSGLGTGAPGAVVLTAVALVVLS